MVEVLLKNTTLRLFRLYNNEISTASTEVICKALATNTTLEQLDLGNNQIDDAKLKEIDLLTSRNYNRNQEIAAKKQASFESVKASAKVLSILSRHRNGIFFSLPTPCIPLGKVF